MKFSELKKPVIIAIIIALLFAFVIYLNQIINVFIYILYIFKPIFLGLILAYLINIPCRFFEKKIFKFIKKHSILRKFLSVITVFIIMSGIIIAAVFLIWPTLTKSLNVLGGEIGNITENFFAWLNSLVDSMGLSKDNSDVLYGKISDLINRIFDNFFIMFANSGMKISEILGSIINVFLALFLAVFLLFGKEKLAEGSTKILLCIFSVKKVEKILEISRYASNLFTKFIVGQGTEFLISGVLCYLGMLIFGIKNALLVSFLIAITSVIPIVGGIIGVIPATLIIMIQSPQKAIIFLIYIFLVQQLEGNLVYPKLVGNSLGISGTWVFIAVIIGGALGGILGVLIGVPLMAFIIKLIHDAVDKKLEMKKLKSTFESSDDS